MTIAITITTIKTYFITIITSIILFNEKRPQARPERLRAQRNNSSNTNTTNDSINDNDD